MRHRIGIETTALGALALLLPGEALAQPIGAAMGPQSRAQVRISVSVMPRFYVSAGTGAKSESGQDDQNLREAPILSANARHLRYSLSTQRSAGPKAAESSGTANRTLTVIVVPD